MVPWTLAPTRWLALGGAAIFALAAIDLGVRYATLPDPEVVVVHQPIAVPTTKVVTTTVTKTIEVPAAPRTPDEPCSELGAGTPPEDWTMDGHHIGPFWACSKPITLAYVKEAMPGYDVTEEPHPMDPSIRYLVVTKGGKRIVTVRSSERDDWPLAVTLYTPAIRTPWNIHVGDRVATLIAHHRDLHGIYGAAEQDEFLAIEHGKADGWFASFRYNIDMRPLGKDRSLVEHADGSEMKLAQLGHLAIESITWTPQLDSPPGRGFR